MPWVGAAPGAMARLPLQPVIPSCRCPGGKGVSREHGWWMPTEVADGARAAVESSRRSSSCSSPSPGEALPRGQQCLARARGACVPLGPQRGTTPPAAPGLSGDAGASLAVPGGCCLSTASSWPPWPAAPLPWLCGATGHITGCSGAPGGRASRAATSSSSPTSPAMAWELFPCALPAERGGEGWEGKAPGQGAAEPRRWARTSLLAKQYSTATRKPWRESRGMRPHHLPLSQGWGGVGLPTPFLGALGAEVPPATAAPAQEAPSCTHSATGLGVGEAASPSLSPRGAPWGEQPSDSPSIVCPGQSKEASCSRLTWKELRKRVKNTLT